LRDLLLQKVCPGTHPRDRSAQESIAVRARSRTSWACPMAARAS
jgi:hypothetical protein